MDRHSRVGFMCLVVIAQVLVHVPAARGQQGYPPGSLMPSAGRSDQPDAIVLRAIRANPLTAPYAITAAWRNGTVVLAGRVGTSVIHDMAVRTVIDLGYPVRDDLVIDTAEAHRVALAQAAGGPWSSPAAGSLVGSAPYFIYPPPLFGRVDDPFFGFEPPLVSFPPQPVLRPGVQDRPNPPRSDVIPQPPGPEPRAALAPRPDAEPRKAVTPDLPMAGDGQRLTRQVAEALARRAPLAGLPISVQSRGDVVTLAGKVPSAYEAMLAYRTVEQTPGVREIADQLQFQVPDENHPNPLRQQGRSEDLEPYLTSQIRRHVGELAHVDRVRVRGDILEIQGTLPSGEDPNRLQAILRSMPLLRDFRLEPVFHWKDLPTIWFRW